MQFTPTNRVMQEKGLCLREEIQEFKDYRAKLDQVATINEKYVI